MSWRAQSVGGKASGQELQRAQSFGERCRGRSFGEGGRLELSLLSPFYSVQALRPRDGATHTKDKSSHLSYPNLEPPSQTCLKICFPDSSRSYHLFNILFACSPDVYFIMNKQRCWGWAIY